MEKTFGVNFTGRLGNQLFTYAFARQLIELYDCRSEHHWFYANFVGTENGPEADGFTDSIKYFNVLPYTTVKYNLIRHQGTILQKLVYFFYATCMRLSFFEDNSRRLIALNKIIARSGLYYSGAEDPAVKIEHLPYRAIFVSVFSKTNRTLMLFAPSW